MDKDGDEITYLWECSQGRLEHKVGEEDYYRILYVESMGIYTVRCTVSDGKSTTTDSVNIQVNSPRPSSVRMVEHLAVNDTMAFERGIDAVPESDGIYIAWYNLKDRNIQHYNIYRKKEQWTYFQKIKTIDLETASPGRDTTYIDDNAEAGLDLNNYYYYFVTATNHEGMESSSQDTLRYMLIGKPELDSPDGESYDPNVDGLPTLFWNFVEIPDLYILRIENSFNQVHYIGIFHSIFDNTYQTLDLSSIPDLPVFIPGVYKWRIDSIGPDEDHSGSESNWKVFIIV